ncbi:MAG: hypothetical protein NWF09_07600 [Candidatus Bathyarchaeota archaeon]|nr:hypothetical protein [Candidatus Bathyarchaeota archaeon]
MIHEREKNLAYSIDDLMKMPSNAGFTQPIRRILEYEEYDGDSIHFSIKHGTPVSVTVEKSSNIQFETELKKVTFKNAEISISHSNGEVYINIKPK